MKKIIESTEKDDKEFFEEWKEKCPKALPAVFDKFQKPEERIGVTIGMDYPCENPSKPYIF